MPLRELEDNCKVNIRFMYLMDNGKPSCMTFGYFINEVLIPSPDYPLWTACVTLAGGKAVHYVCDEQAEWYLVLLGKMI